MPADVTRIPAFRGKKITLTFCKMCHVWGNPARNESPHHQEEECPNFMKDGIFQREDLAGR